MPSAAMISGAPNATAVITRRIRGPRPERSASQTPTPTQPAKIANPVASSQVLGTFAPIANWRIVSVKRLASGVPTMNSARSPPD
jgi:hypothetical protein